MENSTRFHGHNISWIYPPPRMLARHHDTFLSREYLINRHLSRLHPGWGGRSKIYLNDVVPSRKLTWLAGKSPFSKGNTSSNGGFPIVMLVFGGGGGVLHQLPKSWMRSFWNLSLYETNSNPLLMAEILHQLRCIKPCKYWDKTTYQVVQDFSHQQHH